MTNVTVINAYGDKNIGDSTILNVATELINEAFNKKCSISILCENERSIINSVRNFKNIIPLQLPYGYAIRSENGKVSTPLKIIRFFDIIITSCGKVVFDLFLNIGLTDEGFYSYIKAIKKADLVVGMGGGYFIAQSLKDYFGLSLTLLPVFIAKIYRKQIIFLPISFGPFSTKSQENITYYALTNTRVIARDHITYNHLKKLDLKRKIKLSFAPDLALFFDIKKVNIQKKLTSNYITLTAREWFLDKKKQFFFEKSVTEFVDKIWESYKLKTKFIPMAKNKIEDNDTRLAKRICQNLMNRKVFEIVNPKDAAHVQFLQKNARIAICTRMHSAILASTVETPFIAIGYGHKTHGLMQNLKLEQWLIDIEKVNCNLLLDLFKQLIQKNNTKKFIKQIDLFQQKSQKYKQIIIKQLRYQIV